LRSIAVVVFTLIVAGVLAWDAQRSRRGAEQAEAVHARACAASRLALADAHTRQGELERERVSLGRELEEVTAALASSRAAAARELARRLEREREFVAIQRGLLSFAPAAGIEGAGALDGALHVALGLEPPADSPQGIAADEARRREEAAARERERDIMEDAQSRARRFNALLLIHGVRGFDLLEAGVARERGWGPVVLRTVDGDGRLSGNLSAASMHLVGSRSGRTLTLVLRDGHESVGADRRPFVGGERRIALRHVDPEPFAVEFSELFDGGGLAPAVDDGRWSLALVRLRLNELLREGSPNGYHHVVFLGGVAGDELRDLVVEARSADGRIERKMFADRARLELRAGTAVLNLLDGSSTREGQTAPFLDGRLRIVLPRVDPTRWRNAGLPGLSAPPERVGS